MADKSTTDDTLEARDRNGESNSETRGSYRDIAALSLPIMLSNITMPLTGVVDTAVVGRLPGPEPIGAVGLGAHVFAYVFWAFGFLRMGTTGLTAQADGAQQHEDVRDILYRALVVAMVAGVSLLFLGAPIRALALALFPASEAVESLLAVYIEVRVLSAPAAFVSYAIFGWFIGLGKTRVALALQLLLTVSNMVFDSVFVLVFDMGVEGVAFGTLLAEWLAAIVGSLAAAHAVRQLPAGWRSTRARVLDRAQLRRMLSVGRDIMIRTLALVSIFVFFTAQSSSMGDVLLAANGVLLHFVDVTAYFLDGIAHATETLVGRAIGAAKRTLFRRVLRRTTLLAVVVAALFSVIIYLGGDLFVAALTVDEPTRLAASDFVFWAALCPILGVVSYQLDGIFVGATEGVAMRNSALVSLSLFLASFWLLRPFGNHGLWLALVLSYVFRALTLGFYLWRDAERWFLKVEDTPPARLDPT